MTDFQDKPEKKNKTSFADKCRAGLLILCGAGLGGIVGTEAKGQFARVERVEARVTTVEQASCGGRYHYDCSRIGTDKGSFLDSDLFLRGKFNPLTKTMGLQPGCTYEFTVLTPGFFNTEPRLLAAQKDAAAACKPPSR